MKNLLFPLLLICSFCFGKANIEFSQETEGKSITIYISNKEHCPVSVEIDLKLQNMRSSAGKKKLFIVPAGATKFKLTTITPGKPGKSMSYKMSSKAALGDVSDHKYDKNYAYHLPYAKGQAFTVTQGYNGKFTHKGSNALDFGMKVGTPIHAIRDGIVVEVIDKWKRGCLKPKCKKFDNHVLLYHPDGTFSIYGHIKKKGSAVKVGQKVKAGQLIAYSGNVGYSSGPHLHLMIFLPRFGKPFSLQTDFKIENGRSTRLKEKQKYKRNY